MRKATPILWSLYNIPTVWNPLLPGNSFDAASHHRFCLATWTILRHRLRYRSTYRFDSALSETGPLIAVGRAGRASSLHLGASAGCGTCDSAMSDRPHAVLSGRPVVKAGPDSPREKSRFDVKLNDHGNDILKATAAAAMEASIQTARLQQESNHLVERTRIDSAQCSSNSVPQLPSEKPSGHSEIKASPDIRTSPSRDEARRGASTDSIADSPTLRKHAIPIEEGVNTLPVVQPTSPNREAAAAPASSPTGQSLPSFRQLTGQLGQLTDLAEAATQQDARVPPTLHHHSQSISSASHSPLMAFFPPYPNNAHTSPTAYYQPDPRSPASATGEAHQYGSPKQYPVTAYYTDRRRSSAIAETTPIFPPPMPSLPTHSSSGESHGHASSSTDGYSTTHTTPIDGPIPPEGIRRPMLPPPPGMTVVPLEGFRCDYPGCTAPPFQTQYLLR